MNTKYLFLLVTITACCFGISCTQQPGQRQAGPDGPRGTPPPAARDQNEKLKAAEEKRKANEAQLKNMKIDELAKKMEEDAARDVEPFNSPAFREVVSRKAEAGRELAPLVKNPNRSSFLALMALYKVSKDDYAKIAEETRVAILIDALGTSKYFNSWGMPHLYWEDAAKAIIESGHAALPGLRKLLSEKRDAPVWGSEEAGEYQKYKYRLCDYALGMILEIQGKKQEMPVTPEERDRLIASL
jgi:hypothetical protein